MPVNWGWVKSHPLWIVAAACAACAGATWAVANALANKELDGIRGTVTGFAREFDGELAGVNSRLRSIESRITPEVFAPTFVTNEQARKLVIDALVNRLTVSKTLHSQLIPPLRVSISSDLRPGVTAEVSGAVERNAQDVRSVSRRAERNETAITGYHTLPVGSIVAFAGTAASLEGTGWVVANEKNSKTYPMVPNLEDRFLQGAGPRNTFGAIGGNAAILPDGGHTPIGSVSVSLGKNRLKRDGNGFQGEGDECMLWDVSAGFTGRPVKPHNHGGENRPPFHTVRFIVRVQ